MIKSNFNNPIFLFLILLSIISINILTSVNFLFIMLVGVVFNAFYICLKKRYWYSLFFVISTYLFIEINSGLKPFSFTLLALCIYVFILPKIDNSISYSNINAYIYILIYYLGVAFIWWLSFDLHYDSIMFLLMNTVIDLIFLGIFI